MIEIPAAACALLLASAAGAQLSVPRVVSAPAAATVSAGAPAAAAALAAAPSLPLAAAPAALAAGPAPAFAAAPALPASAAAAAVSAPEKGAPASAAHAAAALSEFSRLVRDLMSGDSNRSGAAAAALNELKDAHLNGGAAPKTVKILDLKPMQIPAGMFEVQDKAQALRALKNKAADKWLRDNSVPYVADYAGRKRPVDHHHEARAAWEVGLTDVYAHRYFDEDLHGRIKGLNRDEFYAVTRAMGLFYDRDQFGAGPHDPNHLPEDVRGFGDDPYRSLAAQVRRRGGYDKTAVPFAEFKWANYFRARVKTYPTRAGYERAIAEALLLAHDPAAKDLPGYRPR